MNGRTQAAVVIGVVLAAFAGSTVASGGYGAGVILLFWAVVGTLIVCRVANQNVILIGMIPNTMMAVVINLILLTSDPAPLPQVIMGFLFWIWFTAILSLPISVPAYLLRQRLRKLRRRKILEAKWMTPPDSSK
ncbi:MAG: hypothetical protein M3362_21505 [Acidobacteriota bacterium]|nr:hypothetical protein [Acidobacteriota bacterium]